MESFALACNMWKLRARRKLVYSTRVPESAKWSKLLEASRTTSHMVYCTWTSHYTSILI